jgi:uncharacterized cupredoxin-like copper-binding protein
MRPLLALVTAALLLTACPNNEGPEDASKNAPPKATETSTQNPQAVPENAPRMNPVSPANVQAAGPAVDVMLSEYVITLPDTLPPGVTTFRIANAGKENHNFAIDGNGLSQKLANDLTRGDRATMTVDLKPGTYTIHCPIDGHAGKGMSRTLTVR